MITSTGSSYKTENDLKTYGTVFCGASICTDSWTNRTLKFHIDDSIRVKRKHNNKIYRTNYFRTNYRTLPDVDILVFYETENEKASEIFWKQWDQRKVKTPMIVLITPETQILADEGNRLKTTTRFLRHRGYDIITSLLEGEKCGSSIYDRYMISICTLGNPGTDSRLNFGEFYGTLETRGCFNVIRNYESKDLPTLKYITKPILQASPSSPFPNLIGYYKKEPVFDTSGGVGGLPGKQWIQVEQKGIRRICLDEWIKLKGFNKSDDYEISESGLLRSVSSNAWACIQNAINNRIGTQSIFPVKNTTEANLPNKNTRTTTIPESKTSTWTWAPPRLDDASEFRKAAIKRLKEALLTFPPERRDALYRDGLDCLDKHQHNYGPGGFKKIELLWFMWPMIIGMNWHMVFR